MSWGDHQEPSDVEVAHEVDDLAAVTRRLFPEVNWPEVWAEQPLTVDWLVEPILERGRLVCMYSLAGVGKSLLTLELAAALATGRPVLGQPASPPEHVLYVDLENRTVDVVERLQAYGYQPGDLDRLHYLSFPSLRALDSGAGAAELLACVTTYGATVVVLDTVSRVIGGDENDSSTFLALYRHALVPLKAAGVTVMRLDHAGKDLEKGQRGSSAKEGDVDDIWVLTARSATRFGLRRTKSRSGHGDDHLEIERRFEPLRHLPVRAFAPSGRVAELIAELDASGLPDDAGRERAKSALSSQGFKVGNDVLAEVVRARKARLDLSGTGPEPDDRIGDRQELSGPQDTDDVSAGHTCPGQSADRSGQQGPANADDLSAPSPDVRRGTGEDGRQALPLECPHGVAAGDQPDEWIGGRLKCAQCRAAQLAVKAS
jgi:hypothetical protein